jgi:predicted RNA-binding Zn ribbon-like protein
MFLAHEATTRMLRARTGTSVVGAEDVDVIRQITAAFRALVLHRWGRDPVEFDLADSRVPPRARAALVAAGNCAFPERCTASESITVFVR